MENEMVTITKEEYAHLQESLLWLEALENAGVDNWDGISFAHELMNEE